MKEGSVKDELIAKLDEKGEFYVKYLKFLTAVRGMVDKEGIIYDSLATESKDLMSSDSGKHETLEVVYPDQRILQEGFQEYQSWTEHLSPEDAMHAATYSMLDKILSGSMRFRLLNGKSQEKYLRSTASSVGLIPIPEDGTNEGE